jgi:hypothetical protein
MNYDSGEYFRASGMDVIDFSHVLYPIQIIFLNDSKFEKSSYREYPSKCTPPLKYLECVTKF